MNRIEQQLIQKADDRSSGDFAAQMEHELQEFQRVFALKEGEWVSKPINNKSPLHTGRELSELGLVHARLDAANMVLDGKLVNPRNYQFVDPSGRQRIEQGRVALTQEVCNGLLKMGDGPSGLSAGMANERDATDPEQPNSRKSFVMRLSPEEFDKIPLYMLAKTLINRACDEVVASQGALLSADDFDHSILAPARHVSLYLEDAAGEMHRVISRYAPHSEDRDALAQILQKMLQLRAKEQGLEAEFQQKMPEIETLFSSKDKEHGRF